MKGDGIGDGEGVESAWRRRGRSGRGGVEWEGGVLDGGRGGGGSCGGGCGLGIVGGGGIIVGGGVTAGNSKAGSVVRVDGPAVGAGCVGGGGGGFVTWMREWVSVRGN